MRKLLVIISLFSLFLVSNVIVRAAMPSTVEVTVTSSFDKYNKGISQGAPVSLALGSNLSLDASGIDTENTFAFWVINGVVRNGLSELDSIRVKSSMHIQAVFHKAGEHAVLFVDSNGKLISTEYVLNGEDVTAPSYSGYTKLGMSVDTTIPWKTLNGVTSLTAINSSRVYVLQYTTDVAEVTITLSGATVSSVVANRNDVVTLVASNLSTFKYWKNASDEVLSFESTYVFTATKNMTITAEYADETQTPANLVTISEDLGIREGYDTYVGRFELQSGFAFEYGFLVSKTSSDVTLESSDVEIVKSNAYNAETNEFIMSFTTGSYMSVKAYLIADEGTLVNYVSGSNRTTELSGFASDLFISEYIEGSSSNKAIEIFNGTGSTVNLETFSVKLYTNGSATAGTTLNLTGSLAHNETLVIVNSQAAPELLSLGDVISGITNFNGDDSIELLNGTLVIDSFGQIGYDPGDSWSANGVVSVNLTLIRNSNVNGGRVASSTSFDISEEWVATTLDDFSNLGSHVMTQGTTLSNSDKSLVDINSLSVPPAKKDTVQLSLPIVGPNQSAITWTSDSPHIITNAGIVTLPSGQPETVILTARVVNGSSVRNKEFKVIVGLTDADKVAADKEVLSLVSLTINESGSMGLPTSGTIHNSTITWISSNEDLISNDGLVTLPMSGSTQVTLTATLVNGNSESVTKEFLVTVVSSGTTIDYLTTILSGRSLSDAIGTDSNTTLTAGYSFTTPEPDIDYATGLGLDTSIFDVQFIKNSATMWAVNTGVLRGYYNASGSSEVRILTTGNFLISEITINLKGADATGANSLNVNDVIYDFSIDGSKTTGTDSVNVTGLDTQSLSIQANTSKRMYIESIEIIYYTLNP